ncbi:MAG: DUF4339 domain-containing protein [Planctomycetota bacterium]|nr:DUF4339 domain-containing protein [Planctomycetota bacterium]
MEEPIVILIQLALWVVFGIACAAVANTRGRNPVGWFFIGIIGGCFALAVLFVIPDLKKETALRERETQRRRRLEEELMQERSKNQAFRGHATERLDNHDEALGIDTRSAAPGLRAPPPPPKQIDEGMPAQGWYHVNAAQESMGPFSVAQIRESLQAGRIVRETLVWHESMSDWKPLHESLLAPLLS